jgi:hypothetical protein
MDNLKKLQDEAAEIANRIDAVRAMECESDADIAARDMDLTALVKRADDITGKIDFERKVAESATNIRSVVDRCTPAREQEETRQVARIEPITYSRKLRAFDNPESAYRVGKWLAGTFMGDADAKRWCLDHGVESRAMGESTTAAGGFAVPEEMSSQADPLGRNLWRGSQRYAGRADGLGYAAGAEAAHRRDRRVDRRKQRNLDQRPDRHAGAAGRQEACQRHPCCSRAAA